MKKSDSLTAVGLILGTILMIFGMILEGSSLKIFWDFASILITVGGSFAALLITYPKI